MTFLVVYTILRSQGKLLTLPLEKDNSKHKWMLDKEHLFSINFLSVKKITLLSCLVSKSDLSNLYPKVLGGELGLFHVFQSASYCSLVYGLQ